LSRSWMTTEVLLCPEETQPSGARRAASLRSSRNLAPHTCPSDRLEEIGVLDDDDRGSAPERRWREMADSPDYRNKGSPLMHGAAFFLPKHPDAPGVMTHEVFEFWRSPDQVAAGPSGCRELLRRILPLACRVSRRVPHQW
jgi:hypothetical protein